MNKHVNLIYGSYQNTIYDGLNGGLRALRCTDTGRLSINLEGVSGAVVRPFAPYPAGGGTVAIGAVSNRTLELTMGAAYWLWATVPCWMRYGDNTVVAVANDFPFPANVVAQYFSYLEEDAYIAVIQMAAAGTLYYGRAAVDLMGPV